jgi:hypothetical protein
MSAALEAASAAPTAASEARGRVGGLARLAAGSEAWGEVGEPAACTAAAFGVQCGVGVVTIERASELRSAAVGLAAIEEAVGSGAIKEAFASSALV